jgi:hypothetical protein
MTMLFGELIARIGAGAGVSEVLETVGDIVLFTQIEQMAAHFDETAGEYIAGAAARYAAQAEGDEWLGLVQALQRDPEATTAGLQRILKWSLARDALEIGT